MAFIYDWMRNILNYLGIWDLEAKMLLLGLDNAGKTTLLGMLRDGHLRSSKPTIYPNMEEVQLGGLHFKAFDLGGHQKGRLMWEDYYVETDVIVFIVDAADRDRLYEAADVLNTILKSNKLAHTPIIVLGNKVDRREAISEAEFRSVLNLQTTTGKQGGKLNPHERPIEVFMSSIVKQFGYADAFRWVRQYVKGK